MTPFAFEDGRPPGVSRDLAVWLRTLATDGGDPITRQVAADWFEERGQASTARQLRRDAPPATDFLRLIAEGHVFAAQHGPGASEQADGVFQLLRARVADYERQFQGVTRVRRPSATLPPTVTVPHGCGPVRLATQRLGALVRLAEPGRAAVVSADFARGRCEVCGDQLVTEISSPVLRIKLDGEAAGYITRLLTP